MYSVYEIICLDRGSTPLTSTVLLPPAISLLEVHPLCLDSIQATWTCCKTVYAVCVLEHEFVSEKRGQPRHVVKLPTRACLVLTDRGDKYVKHYTIN